MAVPAGFPVCLAGKIERYLILALRCVKPKLPRKESDLVEIDLIEMNGKLCCGLAALSAPQS